MPTSPSEKSTSSAEYEHLPPILPPSNAVFRHYQPNGPSSTHGFHLNHNKSASTSRKYVTKTMNTTTTVKKPLNGGPALLHTTSSSFQSPKKIANDHHNRRTRKLWWSPKRNYIEIRSEDSVFKDVPSKVGSLDNLEYRPTGGQISIRDEPLQWQASSKIGSLSNANWTSVPSRVAVRSEKIKWDAQSKVGSLINLEHKPAGGNVAIRSDKIDVSHVTPRVDCGFIE